MPRTVSLTRDQRIAAAPDSVWAVVADPAFVPRLDERCRVESTYGSWGSVRSGYVVLVRGARLRYLVTEATPGLRWVAVVERNGKQYSLQRAERARRSPGPLSVIESERQREIETSGSLRRTVDLSPWPGVSRLAYNRTHDRSAGRTCGEWGR